MVGCAAYKCANRSSRKCAKQLEAEQKKTITFHMFPKDAAKRNLWIKAVRREGWVPSQTSRLCSVHFEEKCFFKFTNSVQLREDAVPTVFPGFPSYLQQLPKLRRLPLKRKLFDEHEPVSEATTDNPPSRKPSTSTETSSSSSSGPTMFSRTTSFSPRRLHRPESPTVEVLRGALKTSAGKYRKRIRVLQQAKRRYVKKIANMKNVINALRKQNLLPEDNITVLSNISEFNKEILKRVVKKSKKSPVSRTYAPELRKFALTLHYYSPRAYNYVRKAFDSCLPHPKTLGRWYRTINGEPGFTTESFNAVRQRVAQADHKILCALIIDEMAIRRHVEYDGKKFHGYVDMGTGLEGDDRAIAKDALTFMLVSINDSWKLPVAYFLVDGVNAEQRGNLVLQCLSLANEAGVRVISLTFDGAPANMAMAVKLGCNLDPLNFVTTFKHPATGENVYIFPDPCHMLKLVRNTLGEKGAIFSDGKAILWNYICKLHYLQEAEGMHLANKLRSLHINFSKQKMKVRLASQVFSSSVAQALSFCENELKLTDLVGCAPTADFLELFNNLFDIFNSRNLKQWGFKKPLYHQNYEDIINFLEQASNYILNLRTNKTGELIIQSQRKTGFLGFLICIRSIKDLFQEVCLNNQFLLYMPTYKISQDHIELFFGIIRSHGGFNNNPTSRQFAVAYKKVLVHTELQSSSRGNCIPLEQISILHCSSASPAEQINITTAGYSFEDSDTDLVTVQQETDHLYFPTPQELSEFSTQVIQYIAGFVVRALSNSLVCEECLGVLTRLPKYEKSNYISVKNRGGLVFPSADVIKICEVSEKCIRQALAESGGHHLLKKFTAVKLSSSVLSHFQLCNIFSTLREHIYNQSPMDNHINLLIKAVSLKYIDIRFYYIAKQVINVAESKRHLYNKLVLFSGN